MADTDHGQTTVRVGGINSTADMCDGEQVPPPCAMIIFGASGDLAATKLIPAIFKLSRIGLLPGNFFIIGASRTKLDDEAFRAAMKKELSGSPGFDEAAWTRFAGRLFYLPVNYGGEEAFSGLKTLLEKKEAELGTGGNRIFYLALPPSTYEWTIETIASSGLSTTSGWRRLVIEKPYGRDLNSAMALTAVIRKHFSEDEVYRIDHYLGKETVQNIMMLRFANAIFEPIWNRRYIDHVEITAAESIGIKQRAGYYEQSGVLRDMFQNHMLQVLALTAMEPPSVYKSEFVREERIKVLRAIRPIEPQELQDRLVIGQYVSGNAGSGTVPGYREEEGVAKDSNVPTYAAMKLFIDNWRWQGVPFYLRSGKRLKSSYTQIMIQFRGVPHKMFRDTLENHEIGPNALVLRIQPDERVQLKFHTKNPGTKVCLRDVLMDFSYTEGYKGAALEAYERVLLDCMLGDSMLFISNKGIELTWSLLTPVLESIEKQGKPELTLYRAGTWGPMEAEAFIKRDGRQWSKDGK